jgi:hypothetical protein
MVASANSAATLICPRVRRAFSMRVRHTIKGQNKTRRSRMSDEGKARALSELREACKF